MSKENEVKEKMNRLVKMKEEEQELRENLKDVKHAIVVMSGKGGVGKTTVSVSLGYFLAKRGYRVGILDADVHGPDVPLMLGVEGEKLSVNMEGKIVPFPVMENLDVVSMSFLLERRDQAIIWRGPIKMKALQQLLKDVAWGEKDFLIIDLPPGTGDEPLSIAQLLPRKDGAIVVTTPQQVSLLDARKAVNFAEQLQLPIIGIIENMSGFVCPHCGKVTYIFKKGGGEEAAKELNVPFLGRVPIDPKMVEAGDEGLPKVEMGKESEIFKVFDSIINSVLEIVGDGGQ